MKALSTSWNRLTRWAWNVPKMVSYITRGPHDCNCVYTKHWWESCWKCGRWWLLCLSVWLMVLSSAWAKGMHFQCFLSRWLASWSEKHTRLLGPETYLTTELFAQAAMRDFKIIYALECRRHELHPIQHDVETNMEEAHIVHTVYRSSEALSVCNGKKFEGLNGAIIPWKFSPVSRKMNPWFSNAALVGGATHSANFSAFVDDCEADDPAALISVTRRSP